MDDELLQGRLSQLLRWDDDTAQSVVRLIASAPGDAHLVENVIKDYMGNHPEARRAVEEFVRHATGIAQSQSDAELKNAFNMGVNVKTTIKRKDVSKATRPKKVMLSRKVVNCLCCGKIFDCRENSHEIQTFISTGGICTFCGNRVRLEYTDGTTNEHLTDGNKPSAAAEELRNRLVEFDRQAATRTTVIDDQSDYFAINSNAWLTPEERDQLHRRLQQEEEAAKERRQTVRVTVDLLGRRVIDARDAVNVQDQREEERCRAAFAATAAEKPQGGGAAIVPPIARVGICPNMSTAHYTYIPPDSRARPKKKQTNVQPRRVQDNFDIFDVAAAELAQLVGNAN